MGNLLYPKMTASRRLYDLSGMWKVVFDFDENGEEKNYKDGLLTDEMIPVPSSFADLYTTKEIREFCGDIWYETAVYVPSEWKDMTLELRFSGVAHRAQVFWNGELLTEHEGGFLPFVCDISGKAKIGTSNRLVVKVNNELSATSLPNGATMRLKNGKKMAKPFFDFYNYSGIQRRVDLVATPKTRITDFTVNHIIEGQDTKTEYWVEAENLAENQTIRVKVYDKEDTLVASAEGAEGVIAIQNTHLWQVRNAYLYRFVFQIREGETILDEYEDLIGIRTVAIEGTNILVNGSPVYLTGFGRHEDTPVNGKAFAPCYLKRDFELMKWIGANSFRTSHYPYAEETYQMADKEGFLVIDEVPAVGLVGRVGFNMFFGAGTGEKPKSFFEADTTPQLQKNHLQALKEMITRDKNHACVIAWSLFNEPESVSDAAAEYFRVIFEKAREWDVQKRPRTFAMELSSGPDAVKCHSLCDFWSLNRYYGWYVKGGYEISDAMEEFKAELNAWASQDPVKPMVFTEYGADTNAAQHKLPSVMWSQEYQIEYLEAYNEMFDSYPFIKGEQIWNFADFQTTEGIARVDGNKKGIFTRDRQPKDVAYALKNRWESLPLDYKKD